MNFWRKRAFKTRRFKPKTKRKLLLVGLAVLLIGALTRKIREKKWQKELLDILEKEAQRIPLNPFQECSKFIYR